MLLGLYIKAELEGVTDLIPVDDYEWHFKVQCTSCRETDDNWISFNRQDQYDLQGSKGTANLVMKCKFCKKEGNASFDEKCVIQPYRHEDAPDYDKRTLLQKGDKSKFQRIAVFECRGLELVGFSPMGLWSAKGVESGAPFEDIDLTEEWADYDEKTEEPVGIRDLEATFKKTK